MGLPAKRRLPSAQQCIALCVDDVAGGACGLEEGADVGAVGGGDVGVQIGGSAGDDCIDNVAGGGAANELACSVGLLFGQRDDVASSQHAAELDLAGGAADLGDDMRGEHGDDPGFEMYDMDVSADLISRVTDGCWRSSPNGSPGRLGHEGGA